MAHWRRGLDPHPAQVQGCHPSRTGPGRLLLDGDHELPDLLREMGLIASDVHGLPLWVRLSNEGRWLLSSENRDTPNPLLSGAALDASSPESREPIKTCVQRQGTAARECWGRPRKPVAEKSVRLARTDPRLSKPDLACHPTTGCSASSDWPRRGRGEAAQQGVLALGGIRLTRRAGCGAR